MRRVLSDLVPGSSPDEWQVSSSSATLTATVGRRRLLQGGQQPGGLRLPTAWRRLSRTPSLDAWRLGQPGPAGSLCGSALCAQLLAAGVDLDPTAAITIKPDPSNDLTALRAAGQLARWRAAEDASAATARQRMIGAAVGGAVGGFLGLLLLLAVGPKIVRALRARRAARAKAAAAKQEAAAAAQAAAWAQASKGLSGSGGSDGGSDGSGVIAAVRQQGAFDDARRSGGGDQRQQLGRVLV